MKKRAARMLTFLNCGNFNLTPILRRFCAKDKPKGSTAGRDKKAT
jgi:hypothetical protein